MGVILVWAFVAIIECLENLTGGRSRKGIWNWNWKGKFQRLRIRFDRNWKDVY